MAGKDVEVAIGMKHGGARLDCRDSDQAVGHLPHGLAASTTQAVEPRSLLVAIEPAQTQDAKREEEGAEINQMARRSSAGEEFHDDDFGDCELLRVGEDSP